MDNCEQWIDGLFSLNPNPMVVYLVMGIPIIAQPNLMNYTQGNLINTNPVQQNFSQNNWLPNYRHS